MYILKNAIKSITRNKGRNLMIMIIALVIALSACVSLSIREAAETAKEDTLKNLSVTAQLSFDRTSLMKNMNSQSASEGAQEQGSTRQKFDFSALSAGSLTLDDYMGYAGLLSEEDGYYYTLSASLNAGGTILPYGVQEEEETDEEAGEEKTEGKGGKIQQSTADFSLTGYSSYEAMLSLFGEGGTHTISSGEMFEEHSSEAVCVISDELAMYNGLDIGGVVTLSNPDNAEETYELTVVGIYTNTASESGNSRFTVTDPANKIYMSSEALQSMLGDTLSPELSFTYVLASADNYEQFCAAAEAEGLPENYTLSSADLASYESSLTPLNTLGSMTGWFFLIVLAIGGVILVVINIFNLRERKYEVGVLTAIGMRKSKVALQFVCELFLITFVAIILGAGIGAAVSVPVTNTLLAQQVEKAQESEEQLGSNFGMGGKLNGRFSQTSTAKSVDYIASVSSATDLTVILEMILVGLLLTVISSAAAMVTIMRYEPLRILSDRS